MAKKASKYSGYSQQTEQFMEAVEKFIKKKYGKIEPHWQGELDLLATNFEIFMNAKAEIKETGLLVTNRFGALEKNPLLRVITDANIQCIKLVSEFGLSPKAASKIKEGDDEDTDIIKGLLNG
jgi:P27 family predicted phage terminase small subunit